jgi:mannan endo-1,4-beta-mannosidase
MRLIARNLGIGRLVAGITPVAVALLLSAVVSAAEASNVGVVQARDGHFVLNDAPFRFVGTNAYWMAAMLALGSPQHVDDQIGLARSLGFTVMRTWGFADGADNEGVPAERALQPAPGVYNEIAFRALDYVLHQADLAGIRLLIPLVNGNASYGGAAQYVAWCAPGAGERAFYENASCKQMYRRYVSYVLNRRNTYNGRLYKDDPTVFAWELANEPHIVDGAEPTGGVLRAWVAEMAAHYKSIDPLHMVATGEEGYDVTPAGYSPLASYNGQAWLFDGSKGIAFSANTADPNVDFGSIHVYPEYWSLSAAGGSTWIADHVRIARSLGKPLVLGEFGASRDTAATFASWIGTAEAEHAPGMLAWQVMCDVCYGMRDEFGILSTHADVTAVLAAAAARANEPAPAEDGGAGRLGLALNHSKFALGQTAELQVIAPDPGPAPLVDVYLAVVLPADVGPAAGCPSRDAAVFLTEPMAESRLTCLSADPRTFIPWVRGVTPGHIPPSLSFVWTSALPPGPYTFVVALVRPGALAHGSVAPGDVLATATASATFSP